MLQFVILKPVLVLAAFILFYFGLYEDGSFTAAGGYLYITLIYTLSYSAALCSLVLFYVACRDLLRPFRPLPKFILIKSVVFLTYWQVCYTTLGPLDLVLMSSLLHATKQWELHAESLLLDILECIRKTPSFLCSV